MPDMPAIIPAEIAVVGAAVLVMHIVPFVLARIEDMRRRRAQTWSSTVEPSAPRISTVSVPAEQLTEQRQHAQEAPVNGVRSAVEESGATEPASNLAGTAPHVVPEAASGMIAEPSLDVQPIGQTATAVLDGDRPGGPRFEPFAGDTGYRFRLEDLHRVRLAECAGAASSPVWCAGERMAETHSTAIRSAPLLSPYPVRSACLGTVEEESSTVRLHYLLFPSLWPVSRDQAVARAIFEIDTSAGTLRHRLDALRRSDLEDDTRRAIRDSGGEI
ncbi:MAG: hypothetical protein ABSA52_05740 [Candidatus Binatia bacterium]|jgi:hypothetical protein